MTPTWFNTSERVSALVSEAESWRGTPFAGNSSAKGVGVSCQMLVGSLYAAVGCAGVSVDSIPEVPMAQARFSSVSLVDAYFAGLPDGVFTHLEPDCEPLPGDVLGFRINRIVHHLGVALPGGQFIHALDGIGTNISALDDATWQSRLARIWRPCP